jgi:hypothetical protein
MNDNLRNISLQYIKGDNYEKIICFSQKDINTIKKILTKPNYNETNYNRLKKILIVEKSSIGESLLEDLINYISLKDLKENIEDAIKEKQKNLETIKKDNNDSSNNISNKLKELTKISKNLEAKATELYNLIDDNETEKNDESKYNGLKDVLINLYNSSCEKLKTLYNCDEDITDKIDIENLENLEKFIQSNKDSKKDTINIYICQCINYLKNKNIPEHDKKNYLEFVKKLLYFLTILIKLESEINLNNKEKNKVINDNLEKLIKIFKKYLYICENNIKKYERIFDYNDIGSIDEAFMIETYSKFLKKLHKLKQNLENKDTEKIKRELINYLDKFFNLHGINNPEKIENKTEIDYIVQRILNYT